MTFRVPEEPDILDGIYHISVEFASSVDLVKSLWKTFGKAVLKTTNNLEDEWTNRLSVTFQADQSDFLSAIS